MNWAQSVDYVIPLGKYESVSSPDPYYFLIPVMKDKKYGFVDTNGKVTIPLQYNWVKNFTKEGLALVSIDGKNSFYINTKGIKTRDYKEEENSINAYVNKKRIEKTSRDGKKKLYYVLTDKEGKALTPEIPSPKRYFYKYATANNHFINDGRLYTEKGKLVKTPKGMPITGHYEIGGVEYISTRDTNFKGYPEKRSILRLKDFRVVNDKIWKIEAPSEGLCVFYDGNSDLYGYVDQNLKIVIPPTFDKAEGFQNNYAAVRVKSNHYYINKAGKKVSEDYKEVSSFLDNVALVRLQSGKFRFIDTKFNPIGIDYLGLHGNDVYQMIRNASGYSLVRKGTGWGVVNKKGQIITDFDYNSISMKVHKTSVGTYVILTKGEDKKMGIVDEKGTIVLPFEFDTYYYFSPEGSYYLHESVIKNFIIVQKGEQYGLVRLL